MPNVIINGVLTDTATQNRQINGIWISPDGRVFSQSNGWSQPGLASQLYNSYGGPAPAQTNNPSTQPPSNQFTSAINSILNPYGNQSQTPGPNYPNAQPNSPINVPQGYQWEVDARAQAAAAELQRQRDADAAALANQTSTATAAENERTRQAAALEAQKQRDAAAQQQAQANAFANQQRQADEEFKNQQAQLQIAHENSVAQLNSDTQKYLQQQELTIRQQMQQGTIDATSAQNALDRAQREAEFARQLAQNQLEEQHRNDLANLDQQRQDKALALQSDIEHGNLAVSQGQLGVQQSAQDLEERKFASSLAANPVNFVQNELFKRGQNQPNYDVRIDGTPGMTTNQPASGNAIATTGASAGGGQPTYSNDTLASIASMIQGGQGQNGSAPEDFYNPNLGGTGAFGAPIGAPNTLSRSTFGNMSDADKSILASFLHAGVTGTGGQQSGSIDEGDFFKQAANSWVPTLDDSSRKTSYIA